MVMRFVVLFALVGCSGETVTLTVVPNAFDTIVSNPSGLQCHGGSPASFCELEVEPGTEVTLTRSPKSSQCQIAIPSPCMGTSTECRLTIDADITLVIGCINP